MADLEGIQVGEFGKTIWLYCKNKGVLQNISGFDSGSNEIAVKFWSPKPVKRMTIYGGYTSTGSGADGIVEFAFNSSDNPDRSGMWQGQIWLEDVAAGKLIKSQRFTMDVGE
jgi:hypothetical protein